MGTLHTLLERPFDWLVYCTLQASIVVLLILALRFALGRYLEARWGWVLWLVLLVRLVLPTAPASGWSVFNLMSHWRDEPTAANPAPVPTVLHNEPVFRGPVPALPPGGAEPVAAPALPLKAPRFVMPSSRELAELAWAGGAATLLALMLAGHFRFRRRLRDSRPVIAPAVQDLLEECRRAMHVRQHLLLVETEHVRTPSLFGLLRPLLLLPRGMADSLGPERLRHIFLHELAHMRRHDVALGWVLAGLQVLHWFNPLVWLAFRRLRSDRELACDALALAQLSPHEPREYGQTLIELLQRLSRGERSPRLATALLESHADLKGRITMISRFRKGSALGSLPTAILLILLGCAALTDARPASGGGAGADIAGASAAKPDVTTDAEFGGTLQAKVDRLPAGALAVAEVIKAFGEPSQYVWGEKVLDRAELPRVYVMRYPAGFSLLVSGGQVDELRFEQPNFRFDGKLQVGSSQDEVFKALGKPKDTAKGQLTFKDRVLYQDFGPKGSGYYSAHDHHVRMFLRDGKVIALYLTRPGSEFERDDPASRSPADKAFGRGLAAKVAKLDLQTARLADVIKTFGEPREYAWDNRTFTKAKLPEMFVMTYTEDFAVYMGGGQIVELRFEGAGSDYAFEGKLKVGDSMEKALKMLGPPRETVKGQECRFKDRVLYLDMDNRPGSGYYAAADRHIRIFLMDGKVGAIYVTRPGSSAEREGAIPNSPQDQAFNRSLAAKIAKLELQTATLEDVVKAFGEPHEYAWEEKTFKKDNLPQQFVMMYTSDFTIFMSNGRIVELRFEGPDTDYAFEGRLKVGSSLDEALKVLGPPKETVKGEKCLFKDRVLYLNMNQRPGLGYYSAADRHVRMFLRNGKIVALYVTRPGAEKEENRPAAGARSSSR